MARKFQSANPEPQTQAPAVQHQDPLVSVPDGLDLSQRPVSGDGAEAIRGTLARFCRLMGFAKVRGILDSVENEVASESVAASAPREHRSKLWPAGKPLPGVYRKPSREVLPCPRCLRVLLDNNGQAVGCVSSGSTLAFFRCKACGHTWKLPVRES